MHIEVRHIIDAALRKIAVEFNCDSALRLNYEVSDCPFPEDGMLATNLCFHLAKELRGPGPKQLADQVSSLMVAERPRWIVANVGGGGYINITLTTEFFSEILQRLTEVGGGALLQPYSIFGDGFVAPAVVETEKVLTNLELPCPASVFGRLAENDETVRIVRRERWGDLLMLYALLGDAELDAGPFLQGYNSAQNLPWYLNRFSFDLRRIVPANGVVDSLERCPLFRQILQTRQVLRALSYNGDPAVLVRHAQRLVGDFYRIFNHPESRRPGTELAKKLAALCPILEPVVFGLVTMALDLNRDEKWAFPAGDRRFGEA